MATPFSKPFFSVAGQKERLSNVVNVLKIATTGKDTSGQKTSIVSNTGNKVVDKVLSTAANHPYATAAVATAGIMAAKALPAAIATKGGAAAVAGSTGSSAIKNLAIGAVGGAVLGGIFDKGSSANPNQNIIPNQTNTQTSSADQTTTYGDTSIDNSIRNKYFISGSPNTSIGGTYQSNPYAQSPSQDLIPSFSPSQDIAAEQTATASSGTNWLLVAAVIAGAYYLTNENR